MDILNKYQNKMNQIANVSGFLTQNNELKQINSTVNQITSSVSQLNAPLGSAEQILRSIHGEVVSLMTAFGQLFTPMDTFAPKMQSLSDSSVNSLMRITQPAREVEDAFRRLGDEYGDVIYTRFVDETNEIQRAYRAWNVYSHEVDNVTRKHNFFRSILDRLKGTIKSETDGISKEDRTLKSKNNTLGKAQKGHTSLLKVLAKLGRTLVSEITSINIFGNGLNKLNTPVNLLKRALGDLIGIKLAEWLSRVVNESIRYTENLNLFTVAMGKSYKEASEFVSQMQEIYGMDPSNLMRYAGNFYQLSDAIDMPSKAAANLSLGLTKATNDIASLVNVDIETVFNNLSSGMQGMSRAVKRYGMDIRVVTLQQTALSLGIEESVNNMSEANRQGLRFITMMRQAANASGDFARTIETPANQLRIFKEQVAQLGRAIGDLFITHISQAIRYINGFVMALRMVITFIGTLLGFVRESQLSEDISSVEDTVADIGDAATKSSKAIKKMLAPFDELIIMSSQASTDTDGLEDLGTLDPAILQAIEDMSWKLEDVRMKANEVRDSLLSFFGFKVDAGEIISWDSKAFEENLINKFPQWTKTIQAVFDNWSKIVQGFKNVFNAVGKVVSTVWSKIVAKFNKFVNDESVSSFIETLADKLNALATFINNNSDTFANLAVLILKIGAAFAVLKTIAPIIATVVKAIKIVVSAVSTLVSGASTAVFVIAGIIAAIAILYASSEDFANSFNNLVSVVIESITPIGEAALSLFTSIWNGLQALWNEHFLPLLQNMGDAFAPVLDSIGALWGNLTVILTDYVALLERVWNETIQPVLGDFLDAISNLMQLFQELWETVIGPVVEYIGEGIQNLWTETLSPTLEEVFTVIGKLVEVITEFWNNVLKPILSWLVKTFGPGITDLLKTVWDAFQQTLEDISQLLSGLLQILEGVLDFLAGVFTGDWERAWKGIVNIFVGVGNTIISVFETVVNFVISLINLLISNVYNGIKGLVNTILGVVESVAEFFGKDIDLTLKGKPPAIPEVSIPRIPEYANGGIPHAGELFMARENGLTEFVGSFGNRSGVMNNDQIVEAVSTGVYNAVVDALGDSSTNTPTAVYVDGTKLFEIVVGQNRKAVVMTGINPLGV